MIFADVVASFGRDRAEAITRMDRVLEMFVVEGIHMWIPLQQRVMRDPDFLAGAFDTNLIKRCCLPGGRM